MGPRWLAAAFVVVATMLVMLPSTSAETQDPPIIGFDFPNGLSTNESMTLSGLIEADSIPDSIDWTIESDSYYLYGHISESLEESHSQNDRMTWSWSIGLDISQSPVCTCYFSITVKV